MRLKTVYQFSKIIFVRFSNIIRKLWEVFMAKKYNLVNKTVGKLKVISLVPKDERPT